MAGMSDNTHLIDEVIAEVRKHPGIVAGGVAVLAAVGFASLFLNQRIGPRRYEVLMDRIDPRGWVDTVALRDRLEQMSTRVHDDADDLGQRASERARGFKARASDRMHDLSDRAQELGHNLGDRARGFADGARERFDDWRDGPRRSRTSRRYAKKARRVAEDARDYASDFAKDHAKEGAALLAVGLVAAAIGAIALEQRKISGK